MPTAHGVEVDLISHKNLVSSYTTGTSVWYRLYFGKSFDRSTTEVRSSSLCLATKATMDWQDNNNNNYCLEEGKKKLLFSLSLSSDTKYDQNSFPFVPPASLVRCLCILVGNKAQ